MVSPKIALHHSDYDVQEDVQTNKNHFSMLVEHSKSNNCIPVSIKYLLKII